MEKRSETDKAKNLPFVFLFTEQGHYYVYDVNQNQVIEIPVAVYNYMNGDAKATLQIEEYVDGLKKEGYLKTNRVQMVEHPMTELASFYLNSKLNHMILQLTQNCNLRCEYCVYSGGYHNRSHTNKKMSFETAKKSIDFLVKHSKDTLKLSLSFYGGEPLLEYSLLQECILYAEKWDYTSSYAYHKGNVGGYFSVRNNGRNYTYGAYHYYVGTWQSAYLPNTIKESGLNWCQLYITPETHNATTIYGQWSPDSV